MPSREELGRRLKSIRLQKGLTLREVELLSGVSMTHTSQIERGMTSPTVGALEKLARALDKTASYFIEEAVLDETSLRSRDDRSTLISEKCGLRLEGLSGGIAGGMLHFCYVKATPVLTEPPRRTHEGEEALTVLKGSIEVVVGEDRYRLRAGDSLHFRSNRPHVFYSNTRSGAEAVWVSTAAPVL
ncbi:MAG: XRE family transcriptional regulator [Candidatus Eisenbacteria bacterium]